MNVNRRKFIQLGSVTLAGLPFAKVANANWYDQALTATDPLFEAFSHPTGLAKPFVRWWWNCNRVEKKEIVRELDLLKAIGIGGVEINPIAFPDGAEAGDAKAINWLSNEWIEILHFALDSARERGIICDLIVGSGWPFGGEYLPKEEQTQMMALGTKNLKGPQKFEFSRAELEKEVDPKVASSNPKKLRELAVLRLVPSHLDEFTPGIDLNQQLKADRIVIDVPAGDHVLYYLIKLTGFENVIHGAPGASGPVLNHYHQAAVEKYLNRMSDAINKGLGGMKGKIRALFSDSFELEGANWCDDMAEQFKKRNGYDLAPYLPFLLFKIVGHAFLADEIYGATLSPKVQEHIANVRYDFETTRLQLFNERFYQPYLAWCKSNGVKSRVQAYGMELHPVEAAMAVDLPEGESWIKPDVGESFPDYDYLPGRAYRPVNKLVTSGAHLAGKKLIGCEEATNTQMVFNEDLQRLKIVGDQSNIAGTTQSIFHGFNYSPKEAAFPGWVRYGTFINERNPLWPYFGKWFGYKARISALLQRAEMFADIAILLPFADIWKNYGTDWYPRPQKARPAYAYALWEAIHQNGNGCDYVSEKVIQQATVADSKLNFGPRKFKYLILAETESLLPDTVKMITKFAAAGGKVICIGKWPDKSAGLKNYDKATQEIKSLISEISQRYPKNLVLYPAPQTSEKMVDWYRGLQEKMAIVPMVKLDTPNADCFQSHYRTPTHDIFLFANFNAVNAHSLQAKFNIKGKSAWLWNAETGERTPFAAVNESYPLVLGPAKSMIIVFEKAKHSQKTILKPYKALETLTSAFALTLNHLDGSHKKIDLPKLVDFKADKELDTFAGQVIYDTTIEVNNPALFKQLNLGTVYGVTELTINGKKMGTRWYGEHIYDLQSSLKAGKNTISIKLTTTMGNYMKSLTKNATAVKWMKNRPLYSQGIIGPITLGS
ncbi:MAG: glycosyl hydrolase [Pedobacter sp.]|nr:glycosyl hydrolase [Pedobacter sp.]MDQ8054545.1 glycosyl hydrolase [Pedobacter sp.]